MFRKGVTRGNSFGDAGFMLVVVLGGGALETHRFRSRESPKHSSGAIIYILWKGVTSGDFW